MILVYSGFGLDGFHCISTLNKTTTTDLI